MRLKEIKPGMIIHCRNLDEKKALLEEAERLGYMWENGQDITDCYMIKISGMTIHFYEKSECTNYRYITWSTKTEGVTEFSDLIIPEMTAEEALKTLAEICHENLTCKSCPLKKDKLCNIERFSDYSGEILKICEQWKSTHERIQTEIETVDICRIIEVLQDGKCVVNEETLKGAYGSTKEEEAQEILKKYISEHEGSYIAVVEHVFRVKE